MADDAEQFRWCGGALFFTDGDVQDLIDSVVHEIPDLESKEAAIRIGLAMSKRIAVAEGGDVGPDGAAARRRRAAL